MWGHALATGEDDNIEYRFKAKDGPYRWSLGQARPRRGADGTTTWFGTCTDIHEQRLMRDQLQAAYADLEAKVVFRTLELKHEVQALQARLAARQGQPH